MPKFRKKPIEIEAHQFTEANKDRVLNLIQCSCSADMRGNVPIIRINTIEGQMIARPGDWIIKGVKGEFYPCKPDIFEATYEAVGS